MNVLIGYKVLYNFGAKIQRGSIESRHSKQHETVVMSLSNKLKRRVHMIRFQSSQNNKYSFIYAIGSYRRRHYRYLIRFWLFEVFGVPEVRLDIPAPSFKSVANTQNYGNEPDAHQLIHPTMTANRGVNEEHYLQARPLW